MAHIYAAMTRLILAASVSVVLVSCSRSQAPSPSPVALPSNGAAARSGGGKAIYYFEGSVDVAHRTMTVVYRAPTGETLAQSTLPYGPAPGDVSFHTCLGTVAWNPTGGVGPGGTLTATVQAVNRMPGTVTGMTAVIDSVSPSDITFATPLASYGAVAPNTASNCGAPSATWTFNDATGEDFNFIGEADGTVGATDAGSGSPCTNPLLSPCVLGNAATPLGSCCIL